MLEPEKLIHNLASRFKRVEAGANTGMIDKIILALYAVYRRDLGNKYLYSKEQTNQQTYQF